MTARTFPQLITSCIPVPSTIDQHMNGPIIRLPFSDGTYIDLWEDDTWGWAYHEESGMLVQPETMGNFPTTARSPREIANLITEVYFRIAQSIIVQNSMTGAFAQRYTPNTMPPGNETCAATRPPSMDGRIEFVTCACGNDEMGAGLWPAVVTDGTARWASASTPEFIKHGAPEWDSRHIGCLECGRVLDMDPSRYRLNNDPETRDEFPVRIPVVQVPVLDVNKWDGEWLA